MTNALCAAAWWAGILIHSTNPAQTTQPSTPTPATLPAVLSSNDPAVDAILDRLETKGNTIRDLRAKVAKEEIETIPVEEITVDKGIILFRRSEPNPRFLIRLDEQIRGNIKKSDRVWFMFDGQYLVERKDKDRQLIKRQFVRDGEKVDVFKLGAGPFPLPFGQSRRDMLTSFTINRTASVPTDPPNTDHLICTPRAGTELAKQFRTVHFFIDRRLELPVRIVAERPRDEDAITRVSFSDIELNVGLAASEFEIEKAAAGYTQEFHPHPDQSAPVRRP